MSAGVPATSAVTATAAVTAVLRASSVAVIGASEDGRKPTGRTIRYLQKYGFAGRIYPVNPHRPTVRGLPAYAGLADLPERPDVALIVVGQGAVEQAVRDCGAAGIPVAILFASGYSEIGPDGAQRERRLIEVAREAGVRLIGPNCVGVVIAGTKLTATFMTGLDQSRFDLRDDGIAFVSQSGAMGAFILNLAQSAGIGLGRFFSVGNEADLSFSDVLEGLVDEGSTRVIAGYIEGIRDGRRFEAALRRAQEKGIPVCLMKVGRSERGAAAAASHTGALAGADAVYASVFERYGVVRAESVEQLLDFTKMLAAPRLPRGERMTIVTLSGGAGALMTDYAEDLGIDVFPWSQEWRSRLSEVLPSFAGTANPIDTTGAIAGDLDLLSDALRIGVENPDTGVLMVLLGNMEAEEDEACERIAAIARSTDKPIVVTWVGGSGRAEGLLAPAGVVVFSDPLRAMRAVGAAIARERREQSQPSALMQDAVTDVRESTPRASIAGLASATGLVDEVAAKELLASYGVPTVEEAAVSGADEASAVARRLGHPVVLKLLSSEVAHKSDIGGVHLGLADDAAVRAAAEAILAVARDHGLSDARIVVQRAVDGQHELILGMSADPTFGPVVVVGMGGVFAELLSDVRLAVAPVGEAEARRMLEGLRGIGVLRGLRGTPPMNEPEVVDAIVAFSRLAHDLGDAVVSIDVNPLLIDREGHPVAVDALIVARGTAEGNRHV
ncbi:MAG: acetate--CoA ligase family protein [Microbacterium sp.]